MRHSKSRFELAFARATLRLRGRDLAYAPLFITFLAALFSIGTPSPILGAIAAAGVLIHAVGLVCLRALREKSVQKAAPEAQDTTSANTMSEIRDWHIGHAHLLGAPKMQAADERTRRLAAEAEESAHGALSLLERLSELPVRAAEDSDLPEISAHEAITAAIQETRTMALTRGIKVRSVRSTLKVRTDPALAAALIKAMLVHAMVAAKGSKVLIGVRRVEAQARFEVWSMAENPALAVNVGNSPNIAARMASILGYQLVARGKSDTSRGYAAIAGHRAPKNEYRLTDPGQPV
jgi:hypothetical protein